MANLVQLKKHLAKIQGITTDPEFKDKPDCIRNDMFIRETDCKHAIDVHMAKMNLSRSKK